MLAFIEGLVGLVEVFALIAEGLLWLVDLLCMVFDLLSWIRGRSNRIARKEARKAREEVPPRDVWNRRVIVLTAIILIVSLTIFLIKR